MVAVVLHAVKLLIVRLCADVEQYGADSRQNEQSRKQQDSRVYCICYSNFSV